jgi:KDO2-lipid IV(A) lauroyltransferase
VEENLALALPHLSPGEREALVRSSYRHLGREAVATLRTAWESAEDVRRRTEVHGLEGVERALAEGRGAIIVTGHLGNWEVGGASVAARGLPVDAVAFRQRNRLFDQELVRSRRRLGMEVVRVGHAPREVIRSLRAGRVPALVADQNVRRGGVFVDFFGLPASTARGPAVFSLRTGAPIFVGVALREGDGAPARYQVHLEEVDIEPSGDLDDDVLRLTAAHTAILERWVRHAPEQYFWVHKRWKTRPEDEAPDSGSHAPGADSEGTAGTA